ncbi:hypothetical protein PVAND_008189 [Polypedilum vanderplanki]|uniref:Double-strand break repair protein n=1 Tax=Polypedilum vanderplanki TaxID=319348 RepID=A0A9J6C900_POLVA|nr:hypothetical protein PVAND_008189 [Polypedilum vanderplanki]
MSGETFEDNANEGIEPENIIKILIATDIHLGYDESNEETGNDSFNTFEEILMLANSRNVDFILLAGDLFHKAQPSANSLNKCIQLLRTYTLGRKEIEFEVTDIATGEPMQFQRNPNFENESLSATTAPINYEDDNINVSYPVFTIHGNHDDVVNSLSAIDILSSSGLVNYFGKWEDLSEIHLRPIIIRKKATSIALYGLSHIPDRRLYNLLENDKVYVEYPGKDIGETVTDYFNILAIHQNRVERGRNNHIPVDMLPNFMNLIVWGHEHDCRIHPEQYSRMFVTQPGSSVATSLCEGESIEKHVGILQVCCNPLSNNIAKHQFLITPVKLKTVRPLIYKSIDFNDYIEELELKENKISVQVETLLSNLVFEMIREAKERLTGHPRQPKSPLLRLRVQYDNVDHLINTRRFGQRFDGVVAKNEDLLLFKKSTRRIRLEKPSIDDKLLKSTKKEDDLNRVEDFVDDYFEKVSEDKDKLSLFNFKCMSDVVRLLVDKDDQDGAEKVLQAQVNAATDYFLETSDNLEPEQLIELAYLYRDGKSFVVHEKTVENMMIRKKSSQSITQSKDFIQPSSTYNESSEDEKLFKSKTPVQSKKKLSESSPSSDFEMDDDQINDSSMKRQQNQSVSTSKRGRGSRGGKSAASMASTSRNTSTRNKSTASTAKKGKAKNDQPSIASQISQLRATRSKGPAATSTQKHSFQFVVSSSDDE